MNICKRTTIYLDHAAATPVEKEVVRAMLPYFSDVYANPGGLHAHALRARTAVETARKSIAHSLSARPQEIIFTATGSESNNLAIVGAIRAYKQQNQKVTPHVIVSSVEHKAVLGTVRALRDAGEITLSEIKVHEDGVVDLKELKKALLPETVLVSIMYANNEVGSIQPIRDIAKLVRHHKKHVTQTMYPLLHTDAIQAVQFLDMHVLKLGVDLLSLSAAKIYGPKGAAALFVKSGVNLDPIVRGGDQEQGLRSGTENVPLIVGFAKALEIADAVRNQETERLALLQEYFFEQLEMHCQPVRINGSLDERLPNNVNVTFMGISGERIVIELDARGIAVSAQSACTSEDEESSYVIKALYPNAHTEDGGVRFSMGRSTKKSDIDRVIKELKKIIERIQKTKKLLDV